MSEVNKFDFYSNPQWRLRENANPENKVVEKDLRTNTVFIANRPQEIQAKKFTTGVQHSRPESETKYRPSIYGLQPTIFKPNTGGLWQYNDGSLHSRPTEQNMNLTMNVPY